MSETEVKQEMTPEAVEKAAVMKHNAMTQLVGIYVDSFSAIMLNGNGVSYHDKVQAARALKEAVSFALDFGVDATNATIRQGGKLAKEVNGLAGVLVQAMDNRMLLLASKMKDEEQTTNETGETNNE
jgi:hypothetical protein